MTERGTDLASQPPHHPGMDRRRFLLTALAGALATPLGASAQQAGKTYTIGWLAMDPPVQGPRPHPREAFIQELKELGWVEGQNIRIERRWAEGHRERLPGLVADLINLNVDLIVAGGGVAAEAKRATSTIPIVLFSALDPVRTGLIASLSRPGGNVTGTAWAPSPEIVDKSLEWLNESVQRLARVSVVWEPGLPGLDIYVRSLESAALRLNITVRKIQMRAMSELEHVFVAVRQHQAQAIVVFGASPIFQNIHHIVERARRQRLPDVYFFREAVLAGGLMSYGVDNSHLYRRTATYVDRILRGAKPGDLPVEQPTKFELAINLKTAKAIGLTIPPSLLLRADLVIE